MILENEDIISLELIESSIYPNLEKEIIEYIIEMQDFSPDKIYTNLSKDHLIKYMGLRDSAAWIDFHKRLEKHLKEVY
jgi:hypothetical protein